MRRSGGARAGQCPLHVVSAWASAQRLVQVREVVEDKANDITAWPVLLDRLDLTGQTVTIDAMGCQRTIATQIIAGDGDDVLAVKGNHPDLYADIRHWFAIAQPGAERHRTVEQGHGRLET